MIPTPRHTATNRRLTIPTYGGHCDYAPEGGPSAVVSPRSLKEFRESQPPAPNADVTEVPATQAAKTSGSATADVTEAPVKK